MLDLTAELYVILLIPQGAKTATTTGTGVLVNNLNTGDLDMAQLMITAITGTGTVTVQLQGAPDNSTWTNLAPTSAMPNTAFPAVAANMTTPITLPVDPRGLAPYIRAVATMSGITAYTIECLLFARKLQIGFGTTSG
jgi:hypothetical protein